MLERPVIPGKTHPDQAGEPSAGQVPGLDRGADAQARSVGEARGY
jgi:hypothetical protein